MDMTDLVKRLRIKAGMIELGELIAWGSDSALMREAADVLERAGSAPAVQGEAYEALQAECEKLREHLRSMIDQTTPLEPVPGNPMWSRRIQLDEVIAERDQLRAECDTLRAKTSLSLGVGDGAGNLFVHGDYDSIKRVQALIFECEKLRKDAERYRWLRADNAYFPEENYIRGGQELDAAIDAAMREVQA